MDADNEICRTTMFFATNGRSGPCPQLAEVWCANQARGLCGLHADDHLRRKQCVPANHSPLAPRS
jgi:hypothetical protein